MRHISVLVIIERECFETVKAIVPMTFLEYALFCQIHGEEINLNTENTTENHLGNTVYSALVVRKDRDAVLNFYSGMWENYVLDDVYSDIAPCKKMICFKII